MSRIVFPLIGLGIGLGAALLGKKKGEMQFPTPNANDWTGWVWPVPIFNGRAPLISDGFSRVKTEEHRFHPGVDIMFKKVAGDPAGLPYSSKGFSSQGGNTPIIAAGPGKIWDAGMSGRGMQILIDHGKHLGGMTTWYQHLASFARSWKKGDEVRAGDHLGTMGGDPAPGGYPLVHLHFEIWFPRKGVPNQAWKADPAQYMRFWNKIRWQLPVA